MPIGEITGILAICALAWLWLDSLKARDIAVEAARAACTAEDLQLLDATVAIAGVSLGRDGEGQVAIRRTYEFEFSTTGDNRLRGSVVLAGHRVVIVYVGPQSVPPRILH